ncbi:hypothetical protein [Polymorphobacter megasporae]|uniref:hypothetical protein n=1 Tax=Glacieibacterium megasporae TaxID=2835787 RepID=UPI001C1E8B3E|nr:hypothetical protein [Polymorphobacter megasporae]UAJ11146.1 hypothetical protein KTC28_05410 [Polymorphobacter megasporae]
MRKSLVAAVLALLVPAMAGADPAPFDLSGPSLQITVARNGHVLPIAEVAQLAEGDELSIRTNLPPDQSAHYLLVAAFLRGATNPPPKTWFFQSQTWTPKGAAGLKLTVPASARQVILFLAPATGGDFSTLVNAVRGRPGALVRASQGLNQASLDHARLVAFLEAVGKRDVLHPDRLETITPLLARSLAVKINPDCLQKVAELQAACLMQNQDSLVLNDGHSNGVADTLTGAGSDVALQLAATPKAGFGYYSPYISAVRDIIGVLSSFHTARYQYIPALATTAGDQLGMILNAVPSFHNPKSVLVAALPAVIPSRLPVLEKIEPAAPVCARNAEVVLPVSGAPLVFATAYAHDMMLRVPTSDGGAIELPAVPVAEKGGFVVATGALAAAHLGDSIEAVLHGSWGFEPFDGPTFQLQTPRPGQWRLADSDTVPVVGRDEPIALTGGAAGCVTGVSLRSASGEARPVAWKASGLDTIALTLPLTKSDAGKMTLLIAHDGAADDAVTVTSYAQRTRVSGFDLHAGDDFGTLTGNRLDEVTTLVVDGATFKPGVLARTKDGDTLRMAADGTAVDWTPGQSTTGRVRFDDGRSKSLKITVGAPRPIVTLIGKNVALPAVAPRLAVKLDDTGQLPHDARLTFSLRMGPDTTFTVRDTVEVATVSGSGSTMLTASAGLTLQDDHVAVAALDAATAFGPSVFGPLHFRVVHDGVASDWQDLGTLVRLPKLDRLRCADKRGACALTGSGLFLIAAVSATPDFAKPVEVPEGYPGDNLAVPRPVDGQLYLKLRDNPAAIARIGG